MPPPRPKSTASAREAPGGLPGRTLAIVFAVAAALVLALQDGIARHMASHYNVIFVTMIRYWIFGCFVLALSHWGQGGIRSAARSANPALQFFRGMLLVLQICILIWSFGNLGLINTHVIFASFPLLVTALSAPFLGERVGWHRWLAVCAGFIGILVIFRPGSSAVSITSLIPIVATLMFACYHVLTKYVARTDSPETSFFWTGVGGMVTISFIGPFFWDPMQGATDWLLMLALAVLGTLGHYLIIRALAIAETSTIQPFFYLQVLFASTIGMVVYGEVFTPYMLVGAAMIIAAGMYTFWRVRRKGGG